MLPPQPDHEEAPASPSRRLTSRQIQSLVAHWTTLFLEPGADPQITPERERNIRSRTSRDGFTFEQLMQAIDGAAQAANDGVLEHERWDTSLTSIFVDQEHVQAFIAYHRDHDDLALLEVLSDARAAMRAA